MPAKMRLQRHGRKRFAYYHIVIADNTIIASQAGILSSIKVSGRMLAGSPAIDYKDYMKSYAIFKNLHKR